MLEGILKRVLQAVLGGGSDISAANPMPVTSETSLDNGIATDGTINTLVDTTRGWQVNIWEDAIVEIVDISTGISYTREIDSNTADTIDFTTHPLPAAVVVGDTYSIRRVVLPQDVYQPKEAYNSSTAAALSVDLDTGLYGGRSQVEVWVNSSGAATFTVFGSRNGADWRDTGLTIVLAGAGADHIGFSNAYRYIRVSTPAVNDNMIEIVSSR